MDLLEADKPSLRASFVFPDTFIGFQGHFPGNPVLPGICMIQSLLAIVQASNEKDLSLEEVVSAKFYTVVGPFERLDFDCRERSLEKGSLQVSAKVTSNGKRIAELKINAAIAP